MSDPSGLVRLLVNELIESTILANACEFFEGCLVVIKSRLRGDWHGSDLRSQLGHDSIHETHCSRPGRCNLRFQLVGQGH